MNKIIGIVGLVLVLIIGYTVTNKESKQTVKTDPVIQKQIIQHQKEHQEKMNTVLNSVKNGMYKCDVILFDIVGGEYVAKDTFAKIGHVNKQNKVISLNFSWINITSPSLDKLGTYSDNTHYVYSTDKRYTYQMDVESNGKVKSSFALEDNLHNRRYAFTNCKIDV